jgi:CheY-like chemotaxis protein
MIRSSQVLLIENNYDDAKVVELALSEVRITNELVRKVDIESALEYLRGKKQDKPCLILLDLNLPQMQTFEFMKIFKADRNINKIPIIALISSEDDKIVAESFKLDIAGFIEKPIDYKKFIEAVRALDIRWILKKSIDDDK